MNYRKLFIAAVLLNIALGAAVYWISRSSQPAATEQAPVARAAVPPASLFGLVRDAVHRLDRDQPVARLRVLEDAVGKSMSARRFDLSLVASFSSVALVLSAVGIYGLLSQIVAQRRHEIGVRLALGATARSVVALVMTSAWWSILAGVGTGLFGAVLASQLLRQFMFGVSATDPRLYGAVGVSLALVALVSAWLPARHAARVDPVATLRG